MKEDKFDTTNLKAGEQIPCVAQVENQNIYIVLRLSVQSTRPGFYFRPRTVSFPQCGLRIIIPEVC